MSFRSVAAKATVPRIVGALTVAAAALVSEGVPAQVRLPDEVAGIDAIVEALISVYDGFDVVALGEMHERRMDSDLRIALVRHPDFASKARTIVVEFATTAEQATLDRYIRGEDVSRAELERVRPNQPGSLTSEDPIYLDFFAAVREVNSRLPAAARIRVFGGEDNRNRDMAAVTILKEHAFRQQGKALVIYGSGHFWRASPSRPEGFIDDSRDLGIVRMLDIDFPGRTFTVLPVHARPMDPVARPDYEKFDRALKTQLRPVMLPLDRLPFSDFTAAESFGGSNITRRDGRWVSIFEGSTLTLGQMADAVVYFGVP